MENYLFELSIRRNCEIEAWLQLPNEFPKILHGRLDINNPLCMKLNDEIEAFNRGELDGHPDRIMWLGETLYEALFPGEIGDLFEKAVHRVREAQEEHPDLRLRVFITVDRNSPSVRNWPLEVLRCRAAGWLATSEKLITLSRRIVIDEMGIKPPSSRDKPPLKILVVVSAPRIADRPIFYPTLESLARWAARPQPPPRPAIPPARAAIESRSAIRKPQIEVKLLGVREEQASGEERVEGIEYIDEPATFAAIGKVTEDWKPHVVHFIGHGQFDDIKGRGSVILVKDEAGDEECCWASEFVDLFGDYRPRLAVLQACGQAREGTGPGFVSLAAELLEYDIRAVVAMQFAIQNDQATDFATGFYEALAEGLDVDSAVQRGRRTVSYASTDRRWRARHFATPVLYVLDPSGIILPIAPPSRITTPQLPVEFEPPRSGGRSDTASLLRELEMQILALQKAKDQLGPGGSNELLELHLFRAIDKASIIKSKLTDNWTIS